MARKSGRIEQAIRTKFIEVKVNPLTFLLARNISDSKSFVLTSESKLKYTLMRSAFWNAVDAIIWQIEELETTTKYTENALDWEQKRDESAKILTFLVIDADWAATHSLDTVFSNSLIFLRNAIFCGLRIIADMMRTKFFYLFFFCVVPFQFFF